MAGLFFNEANPYASLNPTANVGFAGLAPSLTDMVVLGKSLLPKYPELELPQEIRKPPSIGISRDYKKFFVQGITFDVDDAAAALESEKLLDAPGTGLPTDGNWIPLSVGAYKQYLESIRNPSLKRLAAKSFGRGVDIMQALGGRFLQLLGAEELGERIVKQQEIDLAKTAPFERKFTDIETGRDAVEWFVANFAQQGPNLIESVLTAGLGFLAGSAVGGPLAGAGGALAGLMGKAAFKKAVIEAARKKAAGEALTATENKLLREAAGITGAVATTYVQNLATGAADIYGELRDRGVDADDVDARLKALYGSLPYAALESLPEFLLAARLFGHGIGRRALSSDRSGLLKRGAIGFGIGGTTEGLTEAGQEALLLKAAEDEFSSPESITRLVEAFAAGFGVGGPIGGLVNLRSNQPVNLLDPTKPAEQKKPDKPDSNLPIPAPNILPSGPGAAEQPLVGEVISDSPKLLSGSQFTSQLPAPVSPVVPVSEPQFMVTPEGQVYQDQILRQYSDVPPTAPGTQGVLNIFGGTIPAQELAARMQPQQIVQPVQEYIAPIINDPRQQVLQFDIPVEITQPVQPVVNQQSTQPVQPVVNQQLIQPIQPIQPVQPVINQQSTQPVQPVVNQQFTEPVQLPLFTNRQAPKPKRIAKLRRGTSTVLQPVVIEKPQQIVSTEAVQLPLFDETGKPSVFALRPVEVLRRGKSRLPKITLKKEIKNAVQEQSPTQISTFETSEIGPRMGREISIAEKSSGKSKILKTKIPQSEAKIALKKGALERAGRLWEEFADLDTQPKWSKLSDEQKKAWYKVAIEDNRPTIAATQEIAPPKKKKTKLEKETTTTTTTATTTATTATTTATTYVGRNKTLDIEATPAEILEEEMHAAEEAMDIRTFRDAIQTVIYYAYFAGEDTNVKKLAEKARAFLSNTEFTEEQKAAMDEAFLDAAQYETQLEAFYKGGSRRGQPKPWFVYAMSRNLLPSIKTRIINLPTHYKEQIKPARGVLVAKVTETETQFESKQSTTKPELLLAELINDLISRIREYTSLKQQVTFRGKTYANVVELAKRLYAETDEAGRNYIIRGHKLKEYFKEDGSPKMLKSGGRYIITTYELTKEEQRKLEREQKEEANAIAAELREGELERIRLEKEGFREEDAWDDIDGLFYRDDGTVISNTIPVGKIRLLVKSFLNKLYIKPNVFVYANVADLKTRNPDLYRRAAAARKEGDFDTTNAAGYSFGPNIIIFTDFIRTEQQLKFVLAHETLGHFGFRSVVPKDQLNKVLNRIYDADPNLQAAVDAMVANRGMSKLEAIEEYLADNAADLDTSLIARIWNVLKNFLNKLGFKFQDDEARYFINLARKYVRRGDVGNFVNARTISANLQAIDFEQSNGRYARVYAGNLGSRLFAAGALNRRYGGTGGLLGAIDAFYKRLFGLPHDVPGVIGRILEQVQTLDNKARRSYGLSQIYRYLEKQQHYARALLSKYHRMTEFTHSATFFGYGKGVTEEQKQIAGELLARAALLRAAQATDEFIKSFDPLVIIDEAGNIMVDPVVREQIERAGFVTAEEFRKGFEIKYSDGSTVWFQYDVDENSPEWRVYQEIRNAVNEAAIDLMLSNYEAAQSEATRVLNELNRNRRGLNVFTDEDLAAIRRVAEIYKAKRYAGSDVANAGVEIKRSAEEDSERFLIAFGRALFNDDIFAAWMKNPNAKPEIVKDLQEYQGEEYDDIRAALPSLKAKITNERQSYQIQKAIRDLFLFDLQSRNADYYAKRTILGSYVPFTRRGTEQVKLVAIDERGNPVALDETIRSALPYFQFNSRSEALATAEELNKLFGNDEYVLLDEHGREVTVRLKAEVSRTRQSPDLTEAVNFNEFIYVLNRLNIDITPEERERIITILTAQNARARHNLQRSGTEGWDKDVIRSVSEFLETTAHVAAKKLFRHRLDDVLLNDANWLGDDEKLAALKAAVENARTEGERARAQRAYDEYAYMYRYMKASAGENTVIIDGKRVSTLGRGEDYREEAKRVLRWYSETTNITDSTEDMLSGEVGSVLKLITVLMQLGGSVATAVVNLASLVTHSLPYLAYYNPARAVGGGYGEAKALTALWRAAKNLKNYNLAEASFLEKILREGTYEKFGLTNDEAQFLFEQTEQGTLQAAQFNALIGTARGKVFNNKAQAAIKAWMSLFSYTEQFNRRVTALAAYRLEKERLLAQGVTDEQEIIYRATEAARMAVTTAQGEYAMFNRPEMARGNVLQYVFMYKQFVIITVQLLRGLPPKGQLLMLGLLFLMSGLRGLPFAEDIFDVVSTIAQKLGLKTANVEKEIAEWLDAVAPGMTPIVMRGVLDNITGVAIAPRLGLGDLVPLTGAFKAGAEPTRELANFAGPVFSGISGLIGMAGNIAKYGAEVLGIRDDVTSFNSILRNSPIAAVRAIADGLTYLDSGVITNARGQIISREAPYHIIIARMLGFYPAVAVEQNDIVRISKDVASYAKAIKADFVAAYVKAKLAGDTKRMQEILADVQQWNEDAKGTGLEISNFLRSANRAANEALRPTALRYLKIAPKHVRPETRELLRISGLEDDIY